MKVHGFLLLLILSGCAHVSPGGCALLPLREYNADFTMRFREEIKNLPPSSAVAGFLVDSVALRDAARACKGGS